MADVSRFFLMRWDFRSLSVDNVCPKRSVRGSVGRAPTGGRLWPRSCLPLSQINSNCLLQLFTGTMSDVFLYSRRLQTPNRRFIMQIKGRRGKTEKIGLKRMTKWLAEVWEGWIHWVLHLQNGFLMPRYRTQTLANRDTFSRGKKKKKPWGTHERENTLINIALN